MRQTFGFSYIGNAIFSYIIPIIRRNLLDVISTTENGLDDCALGLCKVQFVRGKIFRATSIVSAVVGYPGFSIIGKEGSGTFLSSGNRAHH